MAKYWSRVKRRYLLFKLAFLLLSVNDRLGVQGITPLNIRLMGIFEISIPND